MISSYLIKIRDCRALLAMTKRKECHREGCKPMAISFFKTEYYIKETFISYFEQKKTLNSL